MKVVRTTSAPPAKAVECGRETDAEEWAMRDGMSMARKHLPDASFEARAALASDIAEALTSVRRACQQGLL